MPSRPKHLNQGGGHLAQLGCRRTVGNQQAPATFFKWSGLHKSLQRFGNQGLDQCQPAGGFRRQSAEMRESRGSLHRLKQCEGGVSANVLHEVSSMTRSYRLDAQVKYSVTRANEGRPGYCSGSRSASVWSRARNTGLNSGQPPSVSVFLFRRPRGFGCLPHMRARWPRTHGHESPHQDLRQSQ